MGTKLNVATTGTLYDYWGSTISETLLADLTSQTINDNTEIDDSPLKKEITKKTDNKKLKTAKIVKNENENKNENGNDSRERGRVKVIVNLASQEYFKSVQKNVLLGDSSVRIVDCVFKHQGRILSVYAKRARGLMANYIVTHAVNPYSPTPTSTSTFTSLLDTSSSGGDDAGKICYVICILYL